MEDVDTKDALGALVQAVETNTIVIEHDLTEAVNSALESADDQDQDQDMGDGSMEDMDQEDQDQQDQQDEQDQRDQMQQDNDAHNESSETPAKNKNYSRYDAGRKYREVWQEIHPWVSRAVPDEVWYGENFRMGGFFDDNRLAWLLGTVFRVGNGGNC